MIICERCFCDTEVISVIRNKAEIGDCPLCKSKNVHIYDTDRTDKYEDLSMMFDELLSIYTPISLLPDSYPKSDTRLLKSELINNWNIFNKKTESDVYNIITAICKEKYEYNAELFDQPVGIQELYDQEYLSKHSLLTTNSWDDFVKALKTKNRFHTHYVDWIYWNVSVHIFVNHIRQEKYSIDAEFQQRKEFLLEKWERRQLIRQQMVEQMQEGLDACI